MFGVVQTKGASVSSQSKRSTLQLTTKSCVVCDQLMEDYHRATHCDGTTSRSKQNQLSWPRYYDTELLLLCGHCSAITSFGQESTSPIVDRLATYILVHSTIRGKSTPLRRATLSDNVGRSLVLRTKNGRTRIAQDASLRRFTTY